MLFIKNTIINKFKLYKNKIIEYIKFNIIGCANFLVAQCFYLTLYLVFKINYIIAYTITSAISISASYYFNSKYTFKEDHYTLKKYILSILVYIFEYMINLGIIIILVNIFKLNKIVAPFIAPVFSTIPVFFLMRLIIKPKKENK